MLLMFISFHTVSSLAINQPNKKQSCETECDNVYMQCQQKVKGSQSEKLFCNKFKVICDKGCHYGKLTKGDKTPTVSHSGKNHSCIGVCDNEFKQCQQDVGGSQTKGLMCTNFKMVCNHQCHHDKPTTGNKSYT